MTNFEKYENEIMKIKDKMIAVNIKTQVPCPCEKLDCRNCIFFDKDEICTVHFTKWLFEEYKKPIILDDFTKELLKKLYNANWKYITKNKNKKIFIHKEKPHKFFYVWTSSDETIEIKPEIAKFDFILWEDKEPTLIKDLIKNNQKERKNKNV